MQKILQKITKITSSLQDQHILFIYKCLEKNVCNSISCSGYYFDGLICITLKNHPSVCLQYYNKGGMPSRSLSGGICAVCGQRILVEVEEEGFIEDTFQLSCGHMYPAALVSPCIRLFS